MTVSAIVVVFVSAPMMVTTAAMVTIAASSKGTAARIEAAHGTITAMVVAVPEAIVGVVVAGVIRTGVAGMVVGASNHPHQPSQ